MRSSLPVAALVVLVAACGGNSSGSADSAGATPPTPTTHADAGSTNDASAASDAGGDDDDASPIVSGAPSDAGDADDASANDASDAAPISVVDAGPLGRYDVDGPDAVSDFDETVTHSTSSYTVHVYLPSTTGVHPVVVISAGLEQPGDAYAPYAKRLASWGIVAITRDDPGLTHNATSVATDLEYVVSTWLAAENAKTTSKLSNALDVSKIALAGHSKGGQAALLAAEGSAKGHVRAVFGIDPVDSDSLARTSLASIGVPLAMIGETTDDSSNGCAPAADDFLVLYAAASAPAAAITAVHADHTMFEDASACSFCTLCTSGTADQPTVLAYSVRYLTAFFARELLGDTTVGAAFDGAGAGADTTAGNVTITAK